MSLAFYPTRINQCLANVFELSALVFFQSQALGPFVTRKTLIVAEFVAIIVL